MRARDAGKGAKGGLHLAGAAKPGRQAPQASILSSLIAFESSTFPPIRLVA